MVVGICQLDNLILVFFEQGVVEENVFGEQGFAGPGFFGGLVQQDVMVDDDADVAGKDEIRDGCEQHAVIGQGAADKCFGEPDGVELEQFLLGIVGAAFDGADGG